MANQRALTPALRDAFDANVVYPVILCQMDVKSGSIFVWSGIGDLAWDTKIFQGAGNLAAVDIVPESSDLSANNVRLSLSGVPSEYLAIALNEVQQQYYATLWFGAMTPEGALIADPYQIFRGITDVPEISEDGETCTIIVSCESLLADLNRARVFYYTPEDQKLFDSTDKGFDFVAGLQNASIIFA